MNPEDFQVPSAGRVVQAPGGYTAFVPAPLPPELSYDSGLVLALSRADAALSELSGLGRDLPNPHLLIALYVRREAVLSSRIAGTRTSLSDLLLDEAERERSEDADMREVRSYVTALEYGLDRLRDLPLSLRLVSELHERLMRGVRRDEAAPGELRRSQSWIGPAGSTPAPYVPPPPQEMMDCLANWEAFLQDRDRFPDLIQCAVMHAQFEAIHPFLEGNGRVGRLLIPLFLAERDRLSQPLLYLSDYLEGRRQEYSNSLQRVRTHGDWTGWLRFFLAGVEETARAAVRQTRQLLDLRKACRRRMVKKPNVLRMFDELFVNPYLTASRATQILGVTPPTARQAIALLEAEGVLEEVTGRSWGRVYLARTVLETFEERVA